MIDPAEPKTGVISSAANVADTTLVALAWTFTAFDDLTLREVHFDGQGSMLSTDPTFVPLVVGKTNTDFQLRSQLTRDWTNLAFPVPRGTKLYWGIIDLANSQLITLVFS